MRGWSADPISGFPGQSPGKPQLKKGKAGREIQGEEAEGGCNGLMLRMRNGNYDREGWERESGNGISIE